MASLLAIAPLKLWAFGTHLEVGPGLGPELGLGLGLGLGIGLKVGPNIIIYHSKALFLLNLTVVFIFA